MRRSAWPAAFLMIIFSVTVPPVAGAAPPDPPCETVPFGANVKEALEKYEGAEVSRQTTPYIESIGNYALERYFKGGLQRDDSGICFLPGIVQKYVVRGDSLKGCESLTLYFGGFEENADDYRLFMVKKTGRKPAANDDFTEIFEKMAEDLDRTIGAGHFVDQGRIQSFDQQAHTFYLPALVGTWEAGETLAFLMVANSPEGPLAPEQIRVSKPALKRYLEICKTY